MSGISEIAVGDVEEVVAQNRSGEWFDIRLEDLDPWDQMMMRIWEAEEPATSPLMIDPIARVTIKPKPVV